VNANVADDMSIRGTETCSSRSPCSSPSRSLPSRNSPHIANSETHRASTASRVSTLDFHTRSALEKNLAAAASSMKPSVTRVTTSQFPLLPRRRRAACGNSASKKNGITKAAAKESMPSVGQNHSPSAAATTTTPTNATVQVKKTVVEVTAATPTATKSARPPRRTLPAAGPHLASRLLVNDSRNAGAWISNMPSRFSAKKTSTIAKMRLKMGCAANCWTPEAPSTIDSSTPAKVKQATIDTA
jgi:hypothetical protein